MIGPYGETLVVDWGLAKPAGRPEGLAGSAEGTLRPALAGGINPTQMGEVVGTPQYMSPEQAAGQLDCLGPTSDIYSLGAMLYCLLTGRAPFAGQNAGEILARAQRGDFAPPCHVKPRLPAALEAVCLKAMAPNPKDRYASARELADDIEHWLADEPVTAWREPASYRARRWVRNHRVLVASLAAAAGISMILLAGATLILNEARQREANAKQTAEQRTKEAVASLATAEDAVNTFLSEVTEDQILKENDFHDLRARLLQSAVPLFRRLAAAAPGGEDPRPRRAAALTRLAEICQQTGNYEEACTRNREAAGVYSELSDDHPAEPAYRRARALQMSQLAGALASLVRFDEAEAVALQAEREFEELARLYPAEPEHQYDRSQSMALLGGFCKMTRRPFDAEAHFKDALQIADRLCQQHPGVARYQRSAVAVRENLGRLYVFFHLGLRYRRGAEYIREAVSLQEAVLKLEPNNPTRRFELAGLYQLLGMLALQKDERAQAIETFGKALAILQELARRHPGLPVYLFSVAALNDDLARVHLADKRLDRAEEAARESLRSWEQLLDRFPGNLEYKRHLAMPQKHLGDVLAARGSPKVDALKWYDKASANLRAYLEANNDNNDRIVLGTVEEQRGLMLLRLKRYNEALQAFDGAVCAGGQLVNVYQLERTHVIAHLGKYSEAVAAVDAIVRDVGDNPHFGGTICALGAVTYGLAATAVLKDTSLAADQRRSRAAEYSATTVDLLRRSMKAGFFRNNNSEIAKITTLEAFEPLRQRADFAALLKELEKQKSK
jgi:serine/threonine-protein kinase